MADLLINSAPILVSSVSQNVIVTTPVSVHRKHLYNLGMLGVTDPEINDSD